ncbi:hypothetical protein MMC11_008045 [Xylographa trunciseda]|nr:hypothetical protein [Xylographa trunciseda]
MEFAAEDGNNFHCVNVTTTAVIVVESADWDAQCNADNVIGVQNKASVEEETKDTVHKRVFMFLVYIGGKNSGSNRLGLILLKGPIRERQALEAAMLEEWNLAEQA